MSPSSHPNKSRSPVYRFVLERFPATPAVVRAANEALEEPTPPTPGNALTVSVGRARVLGLSRCLSTGRFSDRGGGAHG